MEVADVPDILIETGLLSPFDIVELGVTFSDSSRRNRNFRVTIGDDRGYLIKCARNAETAATLAAEAVAYTAFHELESYREARRWIPNLHGWDAQQARLVLELLPKGISLQNIRRPSPSIFSAMGEALASFHDAGANARTHPPRSRPWALAMHKPMVGLFSELSVANMRLIEILQSQSPLCSSLDRLLQEWKANSTIHCDIKWDNWVVECDEGGALQRLALVDWELACYGDDAWDVGAIFSEFLGQWIESVPAIAGAEPTNISSLVRRPIARMQPNIRSFWSAYAKKRGWAANTATWNLLRAVRMAGARLLQRTWERHQRVYELTGHGVTSIQVASHVLREPHLAAVRLLGISLS